MTEPSSFSLDRRTLLGTLAAMGGTSVAGCSALSPESDDDTGQVDVETARSLAERFAPTLYFDVHEPWFPTDPRPYTSDSDGETVVDGFDALEGYHAAFNAEDPPNPTVFFRAVEYEGSPLTVVQFWMYSVFDQFTTNFHWHDWEVLHVFVDTDTGDPQLYVASAHSRKVPNNEFLDPEPDRIPRILSELGSHSSTLSVNDVPDRFQRVGADEILADITNTAIEEIEDLADIEIPIAYGLPRDEGSRLPYVIPEYEGAPIFDHDRLPSVTRESLIDPELTVRSFEALATSPVNLPTRETGLVWGPPRRASEVDVEYELVPAAEIEHISDFTGPQLSFEFNVPQVIEDAMASHITSTGTPWEQPRYENPALDISVSGHRAALADRFDAVGAPPSITSLVAKVTDAVPTEDAPEDEGLTTTESIVESVVLLESEPEAVPTFGGVAVVQDIPAGEHRMTVNGAGRAPHAERVGVSEDASFTPAGVGGEIPLVARERARKLEIGDAENGSDLAAVALEDDFAGRLYESPVEGSDAVYVHDGGAYTTEVRDREDAIGAYRVNPSTGDGSDLRIERPETGKAPLAEFVADIAEETRVAVGGADEDGDGSTDDNGHTDETADDDREGGSSNAIQGLERALAAVVEAARKAAERARERDRGATDRQLQTVTERLQRVQDRLAEASDDLPDPLSTAAQNRMAQAGRRAEQARESEKLA